MDTKQRTRLGSSDVWVPRVGLGTAPLGGWPTAVTDEQGAETVARAYEQGVRYFDTAPFYGFGRSEEHIGKVLAGVPRDDFILSTKVGRLLQPGQSEAPLYQGAPPLTPVFDFSAEAILRSLDESRERLGFERIDIALIHDPEEHHAEALDWAYPALDQLRSEGTIGAIGVGMNWTEPLARFAKEAPFDCLLEAGRYTLLDQGALDELFPAAEEHGVSIIAGGVYNSGILADPEEKANFDYAEADPALVDRALELRSVCAEFEVPLRAAAIQFPLAHRAVASIVVGAVTPAEVDDNLEMLVFDIPGELWAALKERELIQEDSPTPG